MRYKSTRGGGSGGGVDYSFEQALFSGYAPDAGLFVPTSLPSLFNNESSRQHQFELWSQMSFAQLAYDILRKFISSTEIGNEDLQYICERSFAVDVFDDECIIPIKKVEVGKNKNNSSNNSSNNNSKSSSMMYIAELFRGPTFCFKDFGMRPVIHLLSYFATKRNQPITLLVSTTGDTGPAAVHAVHEIANPLLTILVHYPHGQISDFQRRQLTTLQSRYVKVVSFEGGGDDMDRPIKETLLLSNSSKNNKSKLGQKQQYNVGADDGDDEGNAVKEEGEKGRIFCGINSYNIGRPLMQMIHFIWIYLRMAEELGLQLGDEESPIDLVLPTGAMGNLTGGYMAKQMGIPIGKLCCGVNINDITHRVIDRGEFHHQTIKKTLSEAINIEVPYNFERILFYLTNGDESLVKEWMETMDKTKKLTLDESWLNRLQQDFQSASISDQEMCNVLREVYESCGYVADPHTAVAIAAAKELGYLQFDDDSNGMPTERRRVAIIATASPCKFEEAVTIALGKEAWDGWKRNFFPSRALRTMEMDDAEPFHYRWDRSRHSMFEEVQSEWRDEMMNIVASNFGS